MRKLGTAVVIILALIVVAGLVIPSLVDVNKYHDRIQAELQKRLGRPVSIGTMRLKLLPLAFTVDNAVIGEDPGFPSPRPFAQVQQLDVSAKLWPLLHSDVQIDSLELRNPKVELIRNPQGIWNFSTLGNNPSTAASALAQQTPAQPPAQSAAHPSHKPSPEQPQKPSQTELSLADLKIRNGQIALTDEQKHLPREVYNNIDLELKDFAPNKPFSISATAHLPGAGNQSVSLDGTGGPTNQSDPTKTPFDGRLKLNQVSLTSAQQFLNKPALAGIEGVVTGDMKIKNAQGTVSSNGTLTLNHAHIRDVDIGYPISTDYNITDDLANDLLRIQKGNFKLGQTPLSFSGTVNMNPTPVQLDVKVNASNVSINEAARLAAAMGVALNPGMQIKGRLTTDLHLQGAATKPLLSGSLSAQNLAISGKDLPQPVAINTVDLLLTPETIKSNNFTATTGGTSLNAQFTLLNYASTDPAIDTMLRTTNAQIAELLNIAKAYGISAAEGMSGSGVLSLDIHATGPIKNVSAMTFNGKGIIQNASLHSPQFQQPVNVRSANVRFTQNSASVDNLAAAVGQTNATGSLTVRNLAAPQVQFSLVSDRVNVRELEQLFSRGVQPRQRAEDWKLVQEAYAAPAPPPSVVEKMTGTGTIAIGSVINDQLLLNNVRSNVTLDRGVIRLNPLTSEIYGGQENGSVVIDMRPTPMIYAVSTKLNNVDANKLLASISSVKQLYGLLSANANSRFAAGQPEQMVRTLNGAVSLNLLNGKLSGVDLLNELANIAKFAGFSHTATNFTNIVQLTGGFNVQNGVASTNNLKATIDGGTIAALGDLDLASQAINMHVTAVLSQAMSKMVGGTSIGGLMQTALANNQGELVIPIIVTGNLNHPTIAPDLQKVAQMRLQNLLPTANNPGQLTSGILGAWLGGNKGGTQNQPGGLGGVLGSLAGAQQQRQQNPQQGGVAPPRRQQQQTNNPVNDILNSVFGNGNQQQNQQQDQQHK